MEPVKIPRSLVNQLLEHAQSSPDQEICGLIGGTPQGPTECYPVANVADNPTQLFVMDPQEQINAMRQLREHGEDLFAIYHSHPTSPPQPSLTDLENAFYPQALYLIISLQTQGVLEMRGFRIRDREVVEVPLVL